MHVFTPTLLSALGAASLAGLIVFQVVSAIRLAGKLRAAAEMSARLDRLTAAIGLLTDTTEGGLAALTAEIERLGRRTVVAPRDTKKGSTSRRDDFSQAALDAALAATESHAHLGLFTTPTGDGHASLRA
jgi:hypothetical protein